MYTMDFHKKVMKKEKKYIEVSDIDSICTPCEGTEDLGSLTWNLSSYHRSAVVVVVA